MVYSRKIFDNLAIGLIVALSVVFIISCEKSSVENANSANRAASSEAAAEKNLSKDDVAELLTIVRLPEIPDEVVWREEDVAKKQGESGTPGLTDRKLTAVLRYDSETAVKLVVWIEKNKAPEPAEISPSSWFPEELIAQSQISGNETLKGTVYGANDFTNAPYGNGKITRIENTNYFVLELYTS